MLIRTVAIGMLLLVGSQVHAQQPNIVLVVADDLGYGSLGAYGHPFAKTPNLDRFGEEGLRLTSYYAPAPNCSPSRAGMLTGRHPSRVGIYNWIPEGNPMHLREWEVTIPELLKEEGYDTYHVGKWHLNGWFNSPEQPQPDDHGYDHWMATQNNAEPSHVDPENFVRDGQPLGQVKGLSAHILVNQANAWLQDRPKSDRPFLLVVWFHEPHERINTTEAYRQLYPGRSDMERLYYGDVSHMDEAFGKLMLSLDELGHSDNSFVVFTSDNGPEYRSERSEPGSAAPLRGKKGHTYEGGIRVPAMVRWPGQIAPGTVSDQPVIGTDLLPTIADIVGATLPSDRPYDGQTITPLFRGETLRRQQPMYWQMNNAHHEHKIAMRDGNWKLLATRDCSSFELYNLEEDIGERHNLAGARPQIRERLASKLRMLHDDIEATGHKWPGLNDQGRPIETER